MRFSYGVGNLGKIIGPLGLALIAGWSDLISPKATIDALFPAFLFLAFWFGHRIVDHGQAALTFLMLGFETRTCTDQHPDLACIHAVREAVKGGQKVVELGVAHRERPGDVERGREAGSERGHEKRLTPFRSG